MYAAKARARPASEGKATANGGSEENSTKGNTVKRGKIKGKKEQKTKRESPPSLFGRKLEDEENWIQKQVKESKDANP